MAGAMMTATVIDIILAVVLIFGFVNEEKVIEFEDRIIYALAGAYKRYMRRRRIRKNAEKKAHLRAVPSQKKSTPSFSKTA